MPPISRFEPRAEFETPERCAIVEIHNSAGDAGCSIARARVRPGITTQLHRVRGTAERYVILEGTGAVEIDGAPPVAVHPLDVVHIPEGATQRIRNTGSGDLVFLCVCTPRFEQANYETLGP
jgi:mannose-6-phosphate isomerase-like protein (cupin superfamily)